MSATSDTRNARSHLVDDPRQRGSAARADAGAPSRPRPSSSPRDGRLEDLTEAWPVDLVGERVASPGNRPRLVPAVERDLLKRAGKSLWVWSVTSAGPPAVGKRSTSKPPSSRVRARSSY